MLEKLSRNWIKGLTGVELGLTNLVNMASVAFYQVICTNVPVVMLLIPEREMVEQPEMPSNASITPTRKQREKTWMLKLRTVYPNGLIDRLGDE